MAINLVSTLHSAIMMNPVTATNPSAVFDLETWNDSPKSFEKVFNKEETEVFIIFFSSFRHMSRLVP